MLLCHCHRVSDDAVAAVVSAGATRVGQVVRATRAGTDCGSCIPQLREACALLRTRGPEQLVTSTA
ncbi:MAG: (2Fe-2S)-binding protein [Actinomycetota bacterium]|nr:(2Fe-2S)-binding protein [Actinomycetota bacterium]